MEFLELINAAAAVGTWVVWAGWAWWKDRRNQQLQDARIRDLKAFINAIAKLDVFPTQPNGNDIEV